MVIKGNGYLLQEEARRLGGLTVRNAITFLDDCDPPAATALRGFGDAWLERLVWVRGFGSRLCVEQEQPIRTIARALIPCGITLETEHGTPYVRITAD